MNGICQIGEHARAGHPTPVDAVLYHGTPYGGFDRFEIGRSSIGTQGNIDASIGPHFAESFEAATGFATLTAASWQQRKPAPTAPTVLRCRVRLKRALYIGSESYVQDGQTIPMCRLQGVAMGLSYLDEPKIREIIDADEEEWPGTLLNYITDTHRRYWLNMDIIGLGTEVFAPIMARHVRRHLQKLGFDGVIYDNEVEGGRGIIVFANKNVRILEQVPVPMPETRQSAATR